MNKELFWRFLIRLIGLVLILYSLYSVSIGLFGSETVGTITHIRRIMGERNESIPNRYTYSLGYQFYVSEHEYTGSSTIIASPIYIKVTDKNLIEIKYIKNAPFLNLLSREADINIGKFIMIGFGSFLIYIMKVKKR